jgi:hypothetical protein
VHDEVIGRIAQVGYVVQQALQSLRVVVPAHMGVIQPAGPV